MEITKFTTFSKGKLFYSKIHLTGAYSINAQREISNQASQHTMGFWANQSKITDFIKLYLFTCSELEVNPGIKNYLLLEFFRLRRSTRAQCGSEQQFFLGVVSTILRTSGFGMNTSERRLRCHKEFLELKIFDLEVKIANSENIAFFSTMGRLLRKQQFLLLYRPKLPPISPFSRSQTQYPGIVLSVVFMIRVHALTHLRHPHFPRTLVDSTRLFSVSCWPDPCCTISCIVLCAQATGN